MPHPLGLARRCPSFAEIQGRSYVTPKTVEVHLSNAYRKLSIASRRELPAALAPGTP